MRTLFSSIKKLNVSLFSQKATRHRLYGQMLLVGMTLSTSTILSGCDAHKPHQGVIGYVSGFAGAVSAEEPRAALIGEDVLTAGGTAADAAVAIASTLTVTLPSRAGWAGGGVCLSRLPQEDKPVKVFSFIPQPLPGGGFAPGLPRGLYAPHAASGHMRWEVLLTEAENWARMGTPVSRAFARDLAQVGATVDLKGKAASPFIKNGLLVKEGERMTQMRAASTISTMRAKGVGDVYSGSLAHLIADSVPQLAQERRNALRLYKPQRLDPLVVKTAGNENIYLPPAPFSGPLAAKAWRHAATLKNAEAIRVGSLPANVPYGSTGFVVTDRGGMTVSCVLSMGRLFGSGEILGETGMIAYQPVHKDMDVNSMLPVLVGNRYQNDMRLAATGSGATAVSDAMEFAYRGYIGQASAQMAVADVARKGDALSRVTGVICPDGAPSKVDTCSVPFDPRGSGVSRMVGVEFAPKGTLGGQVQTR